MRKMLLAGVAAAAIGGFALTPLAAHADQISLGSATGTTTFTNVGDGTLSFTAGPFSGSGTFDSPTGTGLYLGTYSLTSMSGTTSTENIHGQFPILTGGSDTFTFTGSGVNSGNSVTGTVQWAAIKDDSPKPNFDVGSILKVTSVTGVDPFLADFPVGSNSEIDFTLNALTAPSTNTNTVSPLTLSGLVATGAKGDELTASSISSGEVVPVPEPGSLALLGTGLLGLAFVGWTMKKRRDA